MDGRLAEDLLEGLNDDVLMQRFIDGETDAFDVLFRRHHRRIYHFARLMLGDAGVAEDILQETFMAVARAGRPGAARFLAQGRFVPWLIRIARNRCINRASSSQMRRRSQSVGATMQTESPAPSPAQQAAVRDELQLVQDALLLLPPSQRQAILLYACEQMTYQEVASVMQVPVNTVRTLIHRGRETLGRSTGGKR
ncbi:MAG: RNA polymerase sigma factor [Phycisphaeraceae bacterium]|nr:RNA polymerase sigma factor [Phycisphaeraceae bacterium]